MRHPILSTERLGCTCTSTLEAMLFYLQEGPPILLGNIYNGLRNDHYVSSVLIFVPNQERLVSNGTVIITRINLPGW